MARDHYLAQGGQEEDGSAALSDREAKRARWQNALRATQKGAAGVRTDVLHWLAQGRVQERRTLGGKHQGRSSGSQGLHDGQ